MAWKFLCATLFMVLWSSVLFHQMCFHTCSDTIECGFACLLPPASHTSSDSSSFSDYLFKLLLIGDSGVGKSCLLLRFAVSFPVSDPSECRDLGLKRCCSCAGWHLHWELHQHHRSGFQDPHHRAGREDHQTADRKCARRGGLNQRDRSERAALPRQRFPLHTDTWSKRWSAGVHTFLRHESAALTHVWDLNKCEMAF